MADSTPQSEATARIRVLRRENRSPEMECVPRCPAPPHAAPLTRPLPPPAPPPLSSHRGKKFSTAENVAARKMLEAEGVEKLLCSRALKAISPKKH